MNPKRIQMSRQHPWRVGNPDAVIVARPSKWGNSFRVGHPDPVDGHVIESREEAVERFRLHAGPMGSFEIDVEEVRRELRGRDLACWCPLDEPCHGDVLIEIANGGR